MRPLSWLKSHLDKWRLCLLVFAITYGILLTINLSIMSMQWDEVTHFTGGLLLSRGQLGLWVWTNSFYPPIFDIVAALFYLIGGASVFAGRLVAVTFSVLTLFVIYEIAKKLYNEKIALVSAILFGVMPGIVWLSRMAMIETLLLFIFSVSMLFFFSWLQTGKERDRIISIAAVAVGVAVKYQMLVVVPIIMIVGMYFWKRDFLKKEAKSFLHFPRVTLIVVGIAAVAIITYALYASGLIKLLLFAIQVGTADKAVYSVRYPQPVFYFLEMAWAGTSNPISLLLYLTGLAGIGFMVYHRRREDKFLLLWFTVVYLVFTLIPNREWRYITVLFPVIAIATSTAIIKIFDKIRSIGQNSKNNFKRRWGTRLAASLLIAFTIGGVFLSCVDAYNWVVKEQIQVPIGEATNFAAQTLGTNQTIAVACPLNRFNKYMVWFYLNLRSPQENVNVTWQYPELAVDAYTPDFNTTEFIAMCQGNNAKYVLLYENGNSTKYFGTTLTEKEVYRMLLETDRFTFEASFGKEPYRIFAMSFK